MGEAKRRKQTGVPSSSNKRRKTWLVGGAAIALALIAGIYLVTKPPEPDSGALPVADPEAPPFPAEVDRFGVSVGPEDAPVVVREFADYQCPGCAVFSEASRRLKEQYVDSGQVRFVFFDLPLRQHQNAMPAAMAARCAGDQDSYWAMHDRLFDNQSDWNSSSDPVATFSRYASDMGLDERRFRRCMTTDLHREDIEQSLRVARQLQVARTPTVIVDNIMLTRPGWGQLSAVVERELAQQ